MTGGPHPRHQVVLVRTWHDHRGAGGCCGSTEAIGTLGRAGDRRRVDAAAGLRPAGADEVVLHADDPTGARYRALRAALPGVRVEVTDSRNWVYLAPWAYRARRAAGESPAAAARAAAAATTPGAVLVDGAVLPLDPHAPVEEVVAAVSARTGTLPG